MEKEKKQFMSIGAGYFAAFLFVQDKFFTYIISFCIFVGLVLVWRKNLIQWMKVNYNLFKDIRKRKYFFVTEKSYKTDLKKRRDLGSAVYSLTNVGFIILILTLSFINKIFGVQIASLGVKLIWGGIIVAFLGILFAIRNYLTGLYYYLLPWIVILCTIDYVHSYSNIEAIVIFIVVVLISYIVLTLSFPLHSLRKITSSTWIFGALTTFLIPLLLEYIFKYYVTDTIHSELINRPITIESLENSNISMDIISFVKENPVIIELISRFRDISVSYELNFISSELSVVRFLLLTSYSIGTIIITLKIKLGESKAKDIFSKIKSERDVSYSELRDCIFYGGDKYEDKIMGNPIFETIILRKEESFDKYIEDTWWIKYPSKFVRGCSFILKKLI
jgi:hypothetical protein